MAKEPGVFEIKNRTPFAVALIPGLSPDGQDIATVTVKGAFALPTGRSTAPLAVHEKQVPVTMADVLNSEVADKASVRYAAESSPAKPATDVALIGHAYPTPASDTEVNVHLRVGPIEKVVSVFGDRVWLPGVIHPKPSKPRPFTKVPLIFERAFGGWDTPSSDPANHAFEARNPAGVGFAASRSSKPDGMPVPNLEDPRALITQPKHRPAPAGFGFISPAWLPRRSYAGTYDSRWQKERSPLLPLDFDPTFYQCSPSDQIVPGYLKGGEPVAVHNASPTGPLAFTVPSRSLEITVWLRGKPTAYRPVMDTFMLDPDEGRAVCVWKTTFACPRQFLYIDLVRIREVSA
jgi:hypothetical protein